VDVLHREAATRASACGDLPPGSVTQNHPYVGAVRALHLDRVLDDAGAAVKVTQSIGGALGAFALALGGYITTLGPGQVQPDSAILAIKASLGLVPAAAAVLAMLVFIKYPLTEKRYRDIVRETDARKQALSAGPTPLLSPVPVPALA
jgi:hypothetical protein